VVSTWVHGGFLQLSGQKIAKSKKNVILVPELEKRGIDPLAFRLLCFGTRYRSEMDFSWEALEGSNERLRHLRQRMADWSAAERPAAGAWSDAAADLDRAFRDAVADDLNMPSALKSVSDVERSKLPDGEKAALLSSWDQVLGLDLERLAREGFDIPPDVQQLVEDRDAARAEKDFAKSDEIRDRLTALGWEVMDSAEGTTVRPR
jgi:cysteinyl-tRNA synthetase